MKRVCIVGSRSIADPNYVFDQIGRFLRETEDVSPVLLSGGAKGVDSLVKAYAKQAGLPFIEFLPYHMVDSAVPFSARYFFSRNRQMVQNADVVLALWDGESTGTQHTIRYAQKIGVPVTVVKKPH